MKRFKFDGPFIGETYEMLKSLAFNSLSPTAHLILVRLKIEYAMSGGRENGKIICTFRQLQDFCGARTAKVRAAIDELAGLGFIKVRNGVPGVKGFGRSTEFGLTYLPKPGTDIMPTDEWKRFDTTEKVVRAKAKVKRRPKSPAPVSPVGDTRTVSPGEDTIEPNSTVGLVPKMPAKSTVSVSLRRHDLDSSKPENRERPTPEVESWWQEAWGNRRMWAEEDTRGAILASLMAEAA
jgi:hypothetical protein